jgi:hypothetical protein
MSIGVGYATTDYEPGPSREHSPSPPCAVMITLPRGLSPMLLLRKPHAPTIASRSTARPALPAPMDAHHAPRSWGETPQHMFMMSFRLMTVEVHNREPESSPTVPDRSSGSKAVSC